MTRFGLSFKFLLKYHLIKCRYLFFSRLTKVLIVSFTVIGCSSDNVEFNGSESSSEALLAYDLAKFPSLTTASYKSIFDLQCSKTLDLSDLSTFVSSKQHNAGLGSAHVEYMFCLDDRGERDRSLLEAHRILKMAELLDDYYSEQAVVMAASYLAEVTIGTAADTAIGSNYLSERNLPPFPTTVAERERKMRSLKRNSDFYSRVFVEKKR